MGVPPGRIRVTGDARFDQVYARIEDRGLTGVAASGAGTVPEDLRPIWSLLRDPDRFTLVAGSTWPKDYDVLLPAIPLVARARPLRVLIAPHEPTPAHLRALERKLDDRGIRHARLSALLAEPANAGSGTDPDPPLVVLIDRLGILADLYALAQAAYVGGGFGKDGLHSVIEPAALGVPVLFGPRHGNAREAGALAAAGGGHVVEGSGGLEDRLRELMDRDRVAAKVGANARRYVLSEMGAAARNASLIEEQL
jgi:3-deoxy-D-manno-octulosonic-acid transferase